MMWWATVAMFLSSVAMSAAKRLNGSICGSTNMRSVLVNQEVFFTLGSNINMSKCTLPLPRRLCFDVTIKNQVKEQDDMVLGGMFNLTRRGRIEHPHTAHRRSMWISLNHLKLLKPDVQYIVNDTLCCKFDVTLCE